jgi:hypothetical protein
MARTVINYQQLTLTLIIHDSVGNDFYKQSAVLTSNFLSMSQLHRIDIYEQSSNLPNTITHPFAAGLLIYL